MVFLLLSVFHPHLPHLHQWQLPPASLRLEALLSSLTRSHTNASANPVRSTTSQNPTTTIVPTNPQSVPPPLFLCSLLFSPMREVFERNRYGQETTQLTASFESGYRLHGKNSSVSRETGLNDFLRSAV